MEPKPLQKPYPVIVHAGQSPTGRRFGAKHADFSFQTGLGDGDLAVLKAVADDSKEIARTEFGRELGILTHGYVVCRDTEKEAQDYLKYYVDEKGDWEAAEGLIKAILGGKEESLPLDKLRQMQRAFIAGWAGYPLVGTAEQIVDELLKLSKAGIAGMAMHWVDYEAGIADFNNKVLPLMVQAGLRKA